MRELALDELRKNQLEILDVVVRFCDERGIKYFLDYGTLLGAVRHKGFIPWDDDIDIGMLRPDYDRFMKEFNGCNPRYECRCIENDPEFEMPFMKVLDKNTVVYEPDENGMKLAVNIDVWPHDNAPDDEAALREMFDLRDKYRNSYYRCLGKIFDYARGNIFRRICVYAVRTMRKIFMRPRFYYVRKIAKNARRYNSAETKRLGSFLSWNNGVLGREFFSEITELEFEGKKYKAPARYDECLTSAYGDYMQLPPEEERVTHHKFKAYTKD